MKPDISELSVEELKRLQEEAEALIAKTEERISSLEYDLEQSSSRGDSLETAKIYKKLSEERDVLERTYARWADLEEKRASLET